MDFINQAMPLLDAMTKNEYTLKEWLTFHKNVWTRNLVARVIDLEHDRVAKEKNPELQVPHEGQILPVELRLEERKMYVQDAVELLNAIELLRCLDAEKLEQTWSSEALAVDADMLPAEEAKASV